MRPLDAFMRGVARYGPRVRVALGVLLLVASLAARISVRDPFGCRAAHTCYPALHAFAAFPYGTAGLFLVDPLLSRRMSRVVWLGWAGVLVGLVVWLRRSAR